MAEGNYPRFLSWALATFHVTFTLTGLALILFLNGSLGRVLDALNTFLGFALFLILWGSTGWVTRRALHSISEEDILTLFTHPVPWRTALRAGLLWGGANGLMFFAFLLVILTAALLGDVLRGLTRVEFPLFFASVGLFGAIASLLVGSILGLGFAVLDSLLLSLVKYPFPSNSLENSSLTE